MGDINYFSIFKAAISSLPISRELTKKDLLVDHFLIDRHRSIEIYYSPHNEFRMDSAKVVIIGLTPGWTQMKIAFQEARKSLELQLPDEEICRRTKIAARFAGSMRRNLIAMLDELEMHHLLQISSCAELFDRRPELLHTVSVLKHPVFVRNKNYSGANPPLMSTPFLRERARSLLDDELGQFPHALMIPLGQAVEHMLRLFIQAGKIKADQCLQGFPHPSGANGHRHRQFAEHKDSMKKQSKMWLELD